MKKVTGYYNEWEYYINLDGQEIYRAGNSPFDSQGYVTPDLGVGVNTMQEYCVKTARQLAAEHKAVYVGSEYEERDN
jgi:hypothetical protein